MFCANSGDTILIFDGCEGICRLSQLDAWTGAFGGHNADYRQVNVINGTYSPRIHQRRSRRRHDQNPENMSDRAGVPEPHVCRGGRIVKFKIFISSVQKEFQQTRKDLKAFLLGDAVLHRFISEVFLFEELPAKDRRADEVYLEQVKHCDIYLGIFGYEYGQEGQGGISPTEREYDYAGNLGRIRLIYVWGADEKQRADKMKMLVRKAGNELIRRRVENVSALTAEVYASLIGLP